MNIAENDIAQAVNAIQSGIYSQITLDLLDGIIERRGASRLMAALVSGGQTSGKTEEETVCQVMEKLEALGNSSQVTACLLMVSLWPIAAKLVGMHEVCDSIGLWVDNCVSVRLAEELNVIAQSEGSEGMRRHCQGWIQNKTKQEPH